MAEEIQLCKADGQEWGFRVTGGADFGTLLTVIKINKGSTGERAGLRVGDMIIQVNDQPLGHMTHFQATDTINKAGNMCKATVIRGSLVDVPQLQVPQIVVQNGTANALPTTGVAGEQEELVLPSLLANLINSGMQEQPGDEEAALNQQNQDTDQEVADSWNFTLPQQLVVTLKSVTPSQLEGRPASPWEIIEERSTFSEKTEREAQHVVRDKNTTAGAKAGHKTGKLPAEAAAPAEATAAAEATASAEATAAEHRAGELPAGATTGEQRQSGTVQSKTEGDQAASEETKEHIEYTEDEIAEMMSGCAEVLAGKCIGVDFQKLPPDTDIMKSEVLHVLIEEKIRKPEKKLTTFQQRPSRPKPRPKGEPELPPAPYLPLKYKGTPKKQEGEPTKDASAHMSEAAEAPLGSEDGVERSQEPTEETEGRVEGEQPEEHNEMGEEITEHENDNAEQAEHPENPSGNQEIPEQVVVDPSDIESQLAEIQNQLAAIIQLPVEIQQHLSFIQTQLSKILEVRAAETTENPECAVEEPMLEGDEHHGETEGEHKEEGETEELVAEEEERVKGEEEEQQATEEEPEPEAEPEALPEPEPEPPKCKKDIHWKKDDEVQKRNKPFFPLTPQPRPVQLPGGRHWYKSRDVYTEDFIAETISGKEEIITGTTIGVDFRKFQCNLDHLKNSSVYKMIHSDDDKRLPGAFASRADMIRAKEDYINPCKPTETTFSFYKTKQILGS